MKTTVTVLAYDRISLEAETKFGDMISVQADIDRVFGEPRMRAYLAKVFGPSTWSAIRSNETYENVSYEWDMRTEACYP